MVPVVGKGPVATIDPSEGTGGTELRHSFSSQRHILLDLDSASMSRGLSPALCPPHLMPPFPHRMAEDLAQSPSAQAKTTR